MAEDPAVLAFAQQLVSVVRDRAIVACDALADGRVRGPLGDRWRAVADGGAIANAVKELLPDVVDQVLFHLLDGIDSGRLPLGWSQDGGRFVSLEEVGEGEMAGWLMMGEGGWIERFSGQRSYDPLAGLHFDDPDGSSPSP